MDYVEHYKAVRARLGIKPVNARVEVPVPEPKVTQNETTRKEHLANDARELSMMRIVRRNRFPTPPLSMKHIFLEVGAHFDVTFAQMRSHTRKSNDVRARHVAFYLCRELTDNSFPTIAIFAHRDHSSVIYGHERVPELIAAGDNILADALATIRRQLEIDYPIDLEAAE